MPIRLIDEILQTLVKAGTLNLTPLKVANWVNMLVFVGVSGAGHLISISLLLPVI